MNWELIGRGLLQYSLVYAIISITLASMFLGVETASLVGIGVGVVFLLLVFGGTGNVRTGTVMANAEAGGFRSGIVTPLDDKIAPISRSVKLFFYAIGLIVCGGGSFLVFVL